MAILLVLYAGLIPIVPLVGVDVFRKRNDKIKMYICWGLFGLQLLISGCAVYFKFFA